MKKLTIRIWRESRQWHWEVINRDPLGVYIDVREGSGSSPDFSDVVVRAQRCYLETLIQYPETREARDTPNPPRSTGYIDSDGD